MVDKRFQIRVGKRKIDADYDAERGTWSVRLPDRPGDYVFGPADGLDDARDRARYAVQHANEITGGRDGWLSRDKVLHLVWEGGRCATCGRKHDI